ncbi:hypothetical protein [Aureibaculum conchae]|uniref:hypothetical protein n=1 Tax=Aureibaculum sp. 2308TA14-22 TaxID=3108392 RepID=UPI0033930851
MEINLILENIKMTSGSFYEKLYEDGIFDDRLFAELILFVDKFNGKKLSETERLQMSSELWELAYLIQSSLGANYNENDGFQITNKEEEKLIEIGNILGYICKSFSENQDLNMDFIQEMT